MFVCKDDGCFNINSEVGSEEWKKGMFDNGICEEDIEIIIDTVNKIRNERQADTVKDKACSDLPDIRMIGGPTKNKTSEQMDNMEKLAKYMFSEAFEK